MGISIGCRAFLRVWRAIGVHEIENLGDIGDGGILLAFQQVSHEQEELLDERHQEVVLINIKEVWESVQDLLGDELIPRLLEL